MTTRILTFRTVSAALAIWVAGCTTTQQPDHVFTLECSGMATDWVKDVNGSPAVPVTATYTVYVRKEGGQWYNWSNAQWHDIGSIDATSYHLLENKVYPFLVHVTINRMSGEWVGGGLMADSISGKCVEGPLRTPPRRT